MYYSLIALFSRFDVLFFKQKTAYDSRISDWSSDVCSSDLGPERPSAPVSRTIGCGHSAARAPSAAISQRSGANQGTDTACRSTANPACSSSEASQSPQPLSPVPPACLLPKPT